MRKEEWSVHGDWEMLTGSFRRLKGGVLGGRQGDQRSKKKTKKGWGKYRIENHGDLTGFRMGEKGIGTK